MSLFSPFHHRVTLSPLGEKSCLSFIYFLGEMSYALNIGEQTCLWTVTSRSAADTASHSADGSHDAGFREVLRFERLWWRRVLSEREAWNGLLCEWKLSVNAEVLLLVLWFSGASGDHCKRCVCVWSEYVYACVKDGEYICSWMSDRDVKVLTKKRY